MNSKNEKELRDGLRVTWVGIGANIILVIIKIYAGFISKSQALIADGIHSLSDLFSDFIVLIGLKWGRMDEDDTHQFGHARIETLSSMGVGFILIIVGAILVYNAVMSIYNHTPTHPTIATIIIALMAIIIKEAMYWYTLIIGKRIKSMALIGNAWHHRTDAMSSIAVLVGILAAFINPKWGLGDIFAALFVTYFIFKVGGRLLWSGLKEIIDTAPDKEVINQIYQFASTSPGVREIHDIRARYFGGQILVELHVVVDPTLSVFEGHEIAAAVKYTVMNCVDDVARVIIHIDPDIKPTL
jgi:cation diffusion facilitator family transporter